jgi:crotonobetainyl-CoA:carnitine CoA-transferase CaiB-like acyl-CoA transferase
MENRNKKSIAINLKEKEGQEVLHRLVKRADIFIEQFRAGVAAKLGADYDTLRLVNPRLVYCAFEGFGVSGPYAGRPAHDLDFEALAGILSVTGTEDRRPVIPGVPIADLASAFNAAFSILAALRRRDATGKGEFVDVSIFDTAVSLMVLNFARYLGTGEIPVPGETLVTGQWAFYNVYETKDGRWITVAAVEPKFWTRLIGVLGLPEFEPDQFAEEPRRGRAIAAFRSTFKGRTLEGWKAVLGKEDIPWAPVQTLPEVVQDPQILSRRMLVETDLGRLGKHKVLAHPAKIEGLSRVTSAHVPRKGEHTAEVLKSLGYMSVEIAHLRKRGVIGP